MNKQNTKNPAGMRSRGRRAQNYLVIWADTSIDLTKKDFQNSMTKLRNVVNDVTICTAIAEYIECLNVLDENKAFAVSSGALVRNLVPEIHDTPKVDAVYIFCGDKSKHE